MIVYDIQLLFQVYNKATLLSSHTQCVRGMISPRDDFAVFWFPRGTICVADLNLQYLGENVYLGLTDLNSHGHN